MGSTRISSPNCRRRPPSLHSLTNSRLRTSRSSWLTLKKKTYRPQLLSPAANRCRPPTDHHLTSRQAERLPDCLPARKKNQSALLEWLHHSFTSDLLVIELKKIRPID